MNRKIAETILIVISFLGVLLLCSFAGSAGRSYLKTPQLHTIDSPLQNYNVWRESGVRGRVLLLFDRRLGSEEDESVLNDNNYLYRAILGNIIRKVYHIIPDNQWDSVRKNLSNMPDVTFSNGVFRNTINGTPLIITTMKDIPEIKEEVLMSIDMEYWNEDGIKMMIELVNKGVIKSDLITISGNVQKDFITRFDSQYEKFQ